MLTFQIAAGIVLAVVILRFWRAAIALAAILFVLAAGTLLYLSATAGNPTALKLWTVVLGMTVMFGIVLAGAAIEWLWRRFVTSRVPS